MLVVDGRHSLWQHSRNIENVSRMALLLNGETIIANGGGDGNGDDSRRPMHRTAARPAACSGEGGQLTLVLQQPHLQLVELQQQLELPPIVPLDASPVFTTTDVNVAPDGLYPAMTTEPQLPVVENDSASRPSRVQDVSRWEFPEDVGDISNFIRESLREGIDAKPVDASSFPSGSQIPKTSSSTTWKTPRPARGKRKRYDEKSLEKNVVGADEQIERSLLGSPRRRRRTSEDPVFEKEVNPKARGIEFDKWFLNYAVAPDGSQMEEKLVWSMQRVDHDIFHDMSDARIEKISDLPNRICKSHSRVGPMYQSRIPTKRRSGDTSIHLDEVPAYDKIWEPKLAETAQKLGQDIAGFLQVTKTDLRTTEFLMTLLHENNYNVECARASTEKVQHCRATFKLNRHRELEDDWCSHQDGKCTYADDEHTLIVCDGCGRAYHPECVKLGGVPQGEWFCPICNQFMAGRSDTIDGATTRKAKVSLQTTSSSAT